LKQHSVIEVASLVRGDVVSVRHLSPRRERAEVLWSAALAALGVTTLMLLTVLIGVPAGRLFIVPAFAAAWLGAGVYAAVIAAQRASQRARRYVIGAQVDADAFADVQVDLVRRCGDRYEIGLVPGMSGTFENGRAPLPVESVTQKGAVRLPLPLDGGRVSVTIGSNTFVVTSRAGDDDDGGARRQPVRPMLAQTVRGGLKIAPVAVMCSVFWTVKAASSMTDLDLKSSVPVNATPWETEKLLRAQAQVQARSLHACFDVLPIECQRQGYVAVGVSLTREGDIRSSWISRSTYGADCPVDACMADRVAGWFFEPIPEPMQVILPVQVLRTGKALPRASLASRQETRAEAPCRTWDTGF